MSRLSAIAVDVALLRRRRELRLLLLGHTGSLLGSRVAFVAVPVQMYDLTGSTVAVGLLGLAEFVPIVGLALLGGALADAFDRRRLMQLAELGAMLVAAGLVVNALSGDPQVWVLYLAGALLAGFTALLRPPYDALVPRLVERHELKAAAALNTMMRHLAATLGPALGGLLIAGPGYAVAYGVDVASFAFSLATLAAVRTPPPPEGRTLGLRSIGEGLRYARSRQELLGTYLVDFNAMLFGFPIALFPAFAEEHGGGAIVGLFYAAPSAGTVLAMLTSGWAAHVHRHGRAVVLAAAGWGLAIVGFGLADALWLALLALVVAGGLDGVSGIFRSVIWNETIPDRLRGRLAGVEMISYSSGPLLGNAEAGLAAAVAGLRTSVVAGGVVTVVGSFALAAALPRLWRYDARAVSVR